MNSFLVRLLSCFILDKAKRHQFVNSNIYHCTKYGNKQIITGQSTQDLIIEKLSSEKPVLICRFGNNEFETLYSYLKKNKKYSKNLQQRMDMGAGFYPVTEETLNKFSKDLLDILPNIDILAAWGSDKEGKICKEYFPQKTEYINLNSLCSITYDTPWTTALKGKKVLVIHPFEDSIKNQYQIRELLFKNKETLPEFKLITMKPVQSIADNKFEYSYNTWFEALEDMKSQIDKIDFDIAIIGAGAYGIFLADYCKKLGKKAVHVGGATQILFGIAGKRWDLEYPIIRDNYYNEYWIRPSENERPKGSEKVENGCYW